MDRFASKSMETQTIYEIYRACRLCGAGGGYKMPIIQNVVNIDGCDVELKQKIRECVQIEVHQDDRMPPLICELCVDKVNDFYEFLEMCRQTNKRTRLRLGLPPQTMPRGAPDAGDCILGVTEPIYVNDEDSNEPLSRKSNVTRSTKFKKEPEKERKEAKVKIGSIQMGRQCRSVRVRAPTPPRSTRDKRDRDRDNESLSKLQTRQKRYPSPPPKSILKKGIEKKVEESPSPTSPRLKRLREKDTKPELPAKRVKIAAKPLPSRSSKPQPPKRAESKESHSPQCKVCKQKFKSPQAMLSHLRSHTVSFTNPKSACNACELWFATPEEASAHHKKHRSRPQSYRCRRCDNSYKLLQAYESHTCLPWYEAPQEECPKCWRMFPTQNLLNHHRCPGISGRRGGKCSKCNKTFSNRKVLTKHENSCKKGEPIVDPEIMARLRPVQVRVARCDPLLVNVKQEHYDVSSVDDDFGLDKACVYPYSAIGLRFKPEMDCMVKINDMDFASYVHWDSEDSGDSDSDNMDFSFTKQHKVESLTAWALKTIFSKKFLGKVPRKFRRLKIENIDSALNDTISDVNSKEKIDSCNVNDSANDSVSDNRNVSVNDRDDDDLFPKENKDDKVTNDDFDSLFNSSDKNLPVIKVGDKDSDSGDLSSCKNSVLKESNDCESNVNDNDSSKVDGESIGVTNSTVSKDSEESQNDLNVAANSSELDSQSKEENSSNVGVKENVEESNGVEESLNSAESKSEGKENQEEINTENSMEVDSRTNSTVTEDVQKSNSESTDNNEVSANNGEEVEKPVESNEIAESVSKDTEIKTIDEPQTKEVSEESSVEDSAKVESLNINSEEPKEKEVSSNNETEVSQTDDNLVNGTSIPDDNLNMDDLEDWSDSEMDDNKLMADLDEQIGEKETQDGQREIADRNNVDEKMGGLPKDVQSAVVMSEKVLKD